MLKLVVVNTKHNKTKPGGGFFKHHPTTEFDLTKYALQKPDDDPDYSENCLVTAFREGGMFDDKLQMVKLFVMNCIIPKCGLKDVCETIEISTKSTSIRNDMSNRMVSCWTCR